MPALTAGLNTIYINLPDEWAYNIVELQPQTSGIMYTVNSLQEVPDVIRNNSVLMRQQQQ
ncbi:hypothetical protein D3C75_1334490 [compost metagenome]